VARLGHHMRAVILPSFTTRRNIIWYWERPVSDS